MFTIFKKHAKTVLNVLEKSTRKELNVGGITNKNRNRKTKREKERGKRIREKEEERERNEIIDFKIQILDMFYRLTMDSIGEIAFGVDICSLEHPNAKFATAFNMA